MSPAHDVPRKRREEIRERASQLRSEIIDTARTFAFNSSWGPRAAAQLRSAFNDLDALQDELHGRDREVSR